MVNVQEWLDKEYPLEKRNEITELNISGKELEGHIKELCEKCRLSPTGFCGDN